jgi:MazG family protein
MVTADELAGTAFAKLVALMRTLRSADGCPWDREQTLESLRPFVLEEAYEVVDAIDRGDLAALAGEVGDLAFEAVFLAQIATEQGAFSIADALTHIHDKLVRRHPHVFGTAPADTSAAQAIDTPAAVVEQWEQIKARERKAGGTPDSLLAGVPRAMPSLLRSYEIGVRVAAVGFDWDTPPQVIAKVEEELEELRDAIGSGAVTDTRARVEEELGDLLFSIAQLARKLGIEPETALRRANDKFTRRFAEVEARVQSAGATLSATPLQMLEAHWQDVKSHE